jgi:hypothetical protein
VDLPAELIALEQRAAMDVLLERGRCDVSYENPAWEE